MHHLPTQLKQLLIAYEKRIIALESEVENLKEKYDGINKQEVQQGSTRKQSQKRPRKQNTESVSTKDE